MKVSETIKKNRNYDEEFKKQTVRLYFEQGKPYRVLSDELGIPEAALAGWISSGKFIKVHQVKRLILKR